MPRSPEQVVGSHTYGASAYATTPDGRRLHTMARGTGEPTVVFESGMGLSRSTWGLVQPRVAERVRAVVYDRAGLGRSDPDPAPRTLRWFADRPGFVVSSRGPNGVVQTVFDPTSGRREMLDALSGLSFFEAAPPGVSLGSSEDDLWLIAGAGTEPVRLTTDGAPERSWSSARQSISSGGPTVVAPIAT